MFRFSAWRLNRQLDQSSSRLQDAELQTQIDKMAGNAGVNPSLCSDIPTINGLAAPDGQYSSPKGSSTNTIERGQRRRNRQRHRPWSGPVALGHQHKRMIDFQAKRHTRLG